jgi:hypothetical protein
LRTCGESRDLPVALVGQDVRRPDWRDPASDGPEESTSGEP